MTVKSGVSFFDFSYKRVSGGHQYRLKVAETLYFVNIAYDKGKFVS